MTIFHRALAGLALDKLPLSLWVQSLSARLFGL